MMDAADCDILRRMAPSGGDGDGGKWWLSESGSGMFGSRCVLHAVLIVHFLTDMLSFGEKTGAGLPEGAQPRTP